MATSRPRFGSQFHIPSSTAGGTSATCWWMTAPQSRLRTRSMLFRVAGGSFSSQMIRYVGGASGFSVWVVLVRIGAPIRQLSRSGSRNWWAMTKDITQLSEKPSFRKGRLVERDDVSGEIGEGPERAPLVGRSA